MEEKIYEVVTKLYSEMQNGFSSVRGDITDMKGDIIDMKGDITDMKGDIIDMKGDITDMKGNITGLRKGQVRLENELKEVKTALFDGYKLTSERLDVLEHKVDKLTVIVESHDVKIEVIRGAK